MFIIVLDQLLFNSVSLIHKGSLQVVSKHFLGPKRSKTLLFFLAYFLVAGFALNLLTRLQCTNAIRSRVVIPFVNWGHNSGSKEYQGSYNHFKLQPPKSHG